MQGVINGASASATPPIPTGTVRTQALQLCCNAVHVQRHARATSGCSAGGDGVSGISLAAERAGIVWHSHGGGEGDNDHNAGHKEVACSSSVAAVDGTRGFGETWRDDTRHVWEEGGKHESYN